MDLFKKDELNNLREKNLKLEQRVKELEENIVSLNKIIEEQKQKEESISSAIVFAVNRSNQLEASRKKLYQLDLQRSRLLYMRMEQVLSELYSRYPELKKDQRLLDMSEKFKQAVYSQPDISSSDSGFNTQVKEDPIRKLLGNIINYIDNEKQGKTISRQAIKIPKPTTYSKPAGQPSFDYMQSKFQQPSFATAPSTSGFDINEALHPSESLEEILKAFDLDKKSKKGNK